MFINYDDQDQDQERQDQDQDQDTLIPTLIIIFTILLVCRYNIINQAKYIFFLN